MKESTMRDAEGPKELQQTGAAEKNRRIALVRGIAVAWIVFVAGYFATEAWSYSGLFAKLSEWQFTTFDQSWPMASFLLISAIFSLPAIMLVVIAGMRRSPRDGMDAQVFHAMRTLRGLKVTGSAFALGSLACLIPVLFLPGTGGSPRELTASNKPDDTFRDGHARITGDVLMSRMTTLEQNMVFTRRQLRLAPLLPGIGEKVVHYLVQVTPTEVEQARTGTPPRTFQGVLVRQGLPGSLRTLYRDAGIPLADAPMVLYRYPNTLYRPYFVAAIQFGFMAMIVLAVWYWQRSRLRELVERSSQPRQPEIETGMILPDDSGLRPIGDVLQETGPLP